MIAMMTTIVVHGNNKSIRTICNDDTTTMINMAINMILMNITLKLNIESDNT